MTLARRVVLVVQRAKHHAGYSGYDRLADWLEEQGALRVSTHPFPRRGTWRLAMPFVRRAGLRWYGPEAFLTEMWAAGTAAWHGGIVHFLYGENSYRYAGAVPRGRGRRLLATFHLPPSVFDKYVMRAHHLGDLDAAVFVAHNQLEILDRLPFRPAAFVVPHGVDVEFYRPPAAARQGQTCLFVGQWLRDFECLGAVVDLVHRVAPHARFVLLLPPGMAPAWTGRPGVEVRSDLDDAALLRTYQEAALLVMPLTDCTANNSVLEAMACGLPLVVTDVGGVRDYVNADCARLVPVGKAAAMAEAVAELMGDSAARETMGRVSRKRAETLAWPCVAKKMEAVYQGLT